MKHEQRWGGRVVALSALLALAGCGPDPTMPMHTAAPPPASGDVIVERIGVFSDDIAYGNRRGVYRIVDQRTGREYLGVSGVGVAETGSHLAGKTSVSDER